MLTEFPKEFFKIFIFFTKSIFDKMALRATEEAAREGASVSDAHGNLLVKLRQAGALQNQVNDAMLDLETEKSKLSQYQCRWSSKSLS